jgi:hypothetical protein
MCLRSAEVLRGSLNGMADLSDSSFCFEGLTAVEPLDRSSLRSGNFMFFSLLVDRLFQSSVTVGAHV